MVPGVNWCPFYIGINMNERIEKLAIGCYQAPEFDYKKFAELIVVECANIIKSDQWAKGNQAWSKGMMYSAEIIKQHFGVE